MSDDEKRRRIRRACERLIKLIDLKAPVDVIKKEITMLAAVIDTGDASRN